MSGLAIGSVSIGLILILVYAGMYVPVALTLISFLGTWFITDNLGVAQSLLTLKAVETIRSQEFGVIPLFVMMGLLVSTSNIAKEVFEVANHYLKRLMGGLGMATVAANAVFAAITGVSIASAAVFTRVAVPEMLRFGYSPRFATGVVAGSSILGMLIPPSILLIVYAFIVEQSVGALFLAAIVPGLILSVLYCVGIYAIARFSPATVGLAPGGATLAVAGGGAVAAPMPSQVDEDDGIDAAAALQRLLPIFALVALVIGGIYGGFFTPTEAGAVGALGALVLTGLKGMLSFKVLWKVAVETGHITASICFLIIAAGMYSSMLGLSGIPGELEAWVRGAGFEVWALITIYIIIILLMGTILDSISIMLIVVPIFLPLFQAFNFDLIWFGVVTIIAVEIGLLTPPLGIAVYVIKSTLDDDRISLKDIFIGAAPFALMMFMVMLLVIAFPGLTSVFR
ncbi:MAG: TRAP transporter large permease subunit [Pseudomonadota bacterium]